MAPFLRYWLPLILYGGFIFIQSSGPVPVDLPSIPGLDKMLHGGGYGLLGILFCRAYRSRWPNASGWATANASLLSAAVYGFTDEFHQAFVPSRTADPFDWLADTFGALLGIAAYSVFLRLRSRRTAHRRAAAQLTRRAGSDR
jgi:VanZ family protein